MKFSQQLHQEIKPVWERCYEHPFLRELADGSLPLDKFQFYLLQDNQYLDAFDELHQFLAQKMPTTAMAESLMAALNPESSELENRESVAEMVGVTDEAIKRTPLAPTATAYINHMYYQSYFVSPEAGVASLLPCYWSYAECFKRMDEPIHQATAAYQAFIDQYADPLFQQSSEILISLVDQLADQADEKTKKQMQTAFDLSSDYELMYWKMCYDREQWPHQQFPAIVNINKGIVG